MYQALERAAAQSGLCLLGSFEPVTADGVPAVAEGRAPHTVVLIGNAGPAMWPHFCRERPGGDHPLDRWSRITLNRLAERFAAHAVFPFQKPYLPFQRWVARADAGRPSPLGLSIHPHFGLWYALRGALLFTQPDALPLTRPQPLPSGAACDRCPDRPCLATCPVAAFSAHGYDVARCTAHLRRPAGRDCLTLGCRARHACPEGAAFRYAPDQAAHHMAAFLTTYGGG